MFVEGHYEVAVRFDDVNSMPEFHLRMLTPDEMPKRVQEQLYMYLVTQPFKPLPHVMNLPPMLQEDTFLSFDASQVAVKRPVLLHTFASSLPAIACIEFESSVTKEALLNRLHNVAVWLDAIVAYDGGSHNVSKVVVTSSQFDLQTGMLPTFLDEDVLFQWHPGQVPAPESVHTHPIVMAYKKSLEEAPRSLAFRSRFPNHHRHHHEQTSVLPVTEEYNYDMSYMDLPMSNLLDVDGKVPVLFGDFIVFFASSHTSEDTFVKTQIVGRAVNEHAFPFELLNNEHVHLPADFAFALFDDKTKTLRSPVAPASRYKYISELYLKLQKHVFMEHV